eukprot:2273058-Amphidinium_carterae.2
MAICYVVQGFLVLAKCFGKFGAATLAHEDLMDTKTKELLTEVRNWVADSQKSLEEGNVDRTKLTLELAKKNVDLLLAQRFGFVHRQVEPPANGPVLQDPNFYMWDFSIEQQLCGTRHRVCHLATMHKVKGYVQRTSATNVTGRAVCPVRHELSRFNAAQIKCALSRFTSPVRVESIQNLSKSGSHGNAVRGNS